MSPFRRSAPLVKGQLSLEGADALRFLQEWTGQTGPTFNLSGGFTPSLMVVGLERVRFAMPEYIMPGIDGSMLDVNAEFTAEAPSFRRY